MPFDEERYCPNCGANLDEQLSFDEDKRVNVCEECNEELLNPDCDDECIWHCNCCGDIMNNQLGWEGETDGFYRCDSCGTYNDLSDPDSYDCYNEDDLIICPNCGEVVGKKDDFDEDEEIVCPNCNETIQFCETDNEDDDEEDYEEDEDDYEEDEEGEYKSMNKNIKYKEDIKDDSELLASLEKEEQCKLVSRTFRQNDFYTLVNLMAEYSTYVNKLNKMYLKLRKKYSAELSDYEKFDFNFYFKPTERARKELISVVFAGKSKLDEAQVERVQHTLIEYQEYLSELLTEDKKQYFKRIERLNIKADKFVDLFYRFLTYIDDIQIEIKRFF